MTPEKRAEMSIDARLAEVEKARAALPAKLFVDKEEFFSIQRSRRIQGLHRHLDADNPLAACLGIADRETGETLALLKLEDLRGKPLKKIFEEAQAWLEEWNRP